MFKEMFKDTWTYSNFCLHSTERNAQAESNGSSRRGTNSHASSVVLHPPLMSVAQVLFSHVRWNLLKHANTRSLSETCCLGKEGASVCQLSQSQRQKEQHGGKEDGEILSIQSFIYNSFLKSFKYLSLPYTGCEGKARMIYHGVFRLCECS